MSFSKNKHVCTLVPMHGFSGLLITYHVPVQALYLLAVHAVSIETHTPGVFHSYIVKYNHILVHVCAYYLMCTCTCTYVCVSLLQ